MRNKNIHWPTKKFRVHFSCSISKTIHTLTVLHSSTLFYTLPYSLPFVHISHPPSFTHWFFSSSKDILSEPPNVSRPHHHPLLFKNTPFFTNVLGYIQNSCSVGVDGPTVSSPVAARAKAGVGPHRDHRSGIDTDGLDTGLAVSFEGTASELTGRVYGTTHDVQAFARHHTRGRCCPFTR